MAIQQLGGISPDFTPVASLVGGVIIGLAASLYLLLLGRIMGVSGIVNGALSGAPDWPSRSLFLSLLALVGCAVMLVHPASFGPLTQPSLGVPGAVTDWVLPAAAGLLVGFGTQMGSGCTSGHGVCGLPRLSLRSLVAVCTFMATGAVTAISSNFIADAVSVPSAAQSPQLGTPWLAAVAGISGAAALALLLLSAWRSLPSPRTSSSAHDGADESSGAAPAAGVPPKAPLAGSSVAGAGPASAAAAPPKDTPLVMLAAAAVALLFGVGLAFSGMLSPVKVRAFLDPFHGWDPSLAFVMGGAVVVNLITFHLILRRQAPVCSGSYCLPTNTAITTDLVVGAALFGIGWGLAGYCPGPGIVSLSTGKVSAIMWLVFFLIGTLAFRFWNKLRQQRSEAFVPADASGLEEVMIGKS